MFEYVKVAHIVFVVCWFAGLLYLPRLFVYHALASDVKTIEVFKIMQRKLYRGIMWPTMILAVLTGLWMLKYYSAPMPIWLHVKFLFVACLVAYHLYCGRIIKTFAANNNTRDHKFYRVFNEVPLVFLILIVVLVVVRPF